MRVVHVAPGHVALDTRVFHKEARTLAEAGYEVTVIAQHPCDEVIEGVQVLGLPKRSSRFQRFVLGHLPLLIRSWKADGHLYHLHDFDAIPVGLVMRLRGRTVIYDSHEDYPRLVMSREWIPIWLRRPVRLGVRMVEWLVARLASAVISAEDEGAARFPRAKTTVVRNYVLDEEFEAMAPGPRSDTVARIVYVGAMSAERGIPELVRALPERAGDRTVELVLLGDLGGMRSELEQLPGWNRVRAPGFASRDLVTATLRSSDVGVLLLHPTKKYAEGAVPVKLFEYMAAGVPVVASDLPTIRSVVAEADCGLLVDPLDVDAVRDGIETLLTDAALAAEMGARGRDHVQAHYLWSREAGGLLETYGALASEYN